MTTAIGIVITEHIVAGRLDDQRLTGATIRYPEDADEVDALSALPGSELIELLAGQIENLAKREPEPVDAIGIAVPGIIRHNVVEDSPNLSQIKGMRLGDELTRALQARNIAAPVHIANDADAIAAGVAATRGQLNKLTRVWTLGNGIGYGRWPYVEGVWEGGHTVVSLDPKERFCGCGGVGHLEGIMGYRAMRLRFLDLEPEEVFAQARQGDPRFLHPPRRPRPLLLHRAQRALP
jgi:glucokinase